MIKFLQRKKKTNEEFPIRWYRFEAMEKNESEFSSWNKNFLKKKWSGQKQDMKLKKIGNDLRKNDPFPTFPRHEMRT